MTEQEEKKNLGGRPRKYEDVKTERLSMRFTPAHKAMVINVGDNLGTGTTGFWYDFMVELSEAVLKLQTGELSEESFRKQFGERTYGRIISAGDEMKPKDETEKD